MFKKNGSFLFSIIILLVLTSNSFAQSFSDVDEMVKKYPSSFANPQKLASQINTDFKSEIDKTRAIFTWIALNVRYDLTAYKNLSGKIAYSYSDENDRLGKERKFRDQLASKTLRSKKGVCQDYTALFHTICDLLEIKVIDITGTSKSHPSQIGKLPNASDHVWNAVKIGADWKFIDVTWASGSVGTNSGKFIPDFNDSYFFTSPEMMFLNHFPDDKRLLLINKTDEEFAALPLYYGPYLKAGFQIISPENGIISSAKATLLPIKIKDLPENAKVTYVFSSEKLSHEADLIKNSKISEFNIPLSPKRRGYLTIFVNSKSVVTYKMER